MTVETLDIDQVKFNDKNPRKITDRKFRKLVDSIRKFPDLMRLRPIIVDDANNVIAGNHRLLACKELGWKSVPVIRYQGSERQKKELLIRDNVQYAEWDLDILVDFAPPDLLADWGVDFFNSFVDAKNFERLIDDVNALVSGPSVSSTSANGGAEGKTNGTDSFVTQDEQDFNKRKLTMVFDTAQEYDAFLLLLRKLAPECFSMGNMHTTKEITAAITTIVYRYSNSRKN